MFRNIWRFLIRVSSFFHKEVINLLRQPRLMATLVLGPFLILLLFGVGYKDAAPVIRTKFVIDDGNPLQPYVAQYAAHLGPQLDYMGLTASEASALLDLQRGEVDAVAVIPGNAMARYEQGENVVVNVYHNEINPQRSSYIEFTIGFYITVLNRRVMVDLLEEEHSQIGTAQENVTSTKRSLEQMQNEIAQAELLRERATATELGRRLDELKPAMETITDTLRSSGDAVPSEEQRWLRETAGLLLTLDEELKALQAMGPVVSPGQMATISDTIGQLGQVQTALTRAQGLAPSVVISPFETKVQNVNAVSLKMMDFYTPGVLALLLQHLSVTFAALSIVQEDRLGALEVFQIAPLSPVEALIGKTLSYLLFNAVIAALLSALVIYGLGVPMLGSWQAYVVTNLGVIFTSLGIGFLISMLARTTSQAVQASMMLLLSSVFFTGFFDGLDSLKSWLRVLSWGLPTTYGIQQLQDIMLRGRSPDWTRFAILMALGVALFGIDLLLLNRRLLPRRH